MSKKSNSTLNLLEPKINSKIFLAKLFNLEEKNIFIKNNKNALKYFKEFVKMQQNKARNSKLSLDLLNLNSHSKIEKFKNNPVLILKSFDKILFDEKKRKFKSQTLGVDEGLIILPKDYYPLPHSPTQNRIRNNLFLKETEIFEGKNSLSANRNIKSVTELEKASETIIVKNNFFTRRNSEKKLNLNSNKFKENFETKLNYNFELKKLDNWDFLNAPIKEESNKKLLILNTKDFRRRSSLIDINTNSPSNDFNNMGLLLKTKQDKNKLKIISRINKLKEFFSDFGKDQDVLLYSGRKRNTKNYLISSFYNNKPLSKEERKDWKDNSNGINYYREMLKVKKRNEKILHDELYKYAERISSAKKEKEDYEKRLIELSQQLKEINEKETNILNDIKVIKASKDKIHKNLNFNNLYNNEIESDRQLIRKLSEEDQYFNGSNKSNNKKANNNQNVETYADKNIFNFSSDKKIFKRNYMLVRKRKNTIVYNTLSKIKKKRKDLIDEIKENNLKIKEKQMKFKKSKDKFNEKVKFLKEYYYQILKKGLDVRKDGLSWVVVKLSELHAFIHKNHFPAFLSSSEIDYLMKVGIKKYELSELIKLFQLLRNTQKKLKEDHIKADRDKINKIKDEKFNQLLETKKDEKYNIGNHYAEYMEEIQRKYENVINIYLNEKAEEEGLNKISQKINKYVLTMKDDDIYEEGKNDDNLYELFFIPGSLSQYFARDKKFRQYFDDIYYLNEEINKRREQLKKMKDSEFKKYKNLIKDNLNAENNEDFVISERSKAFAALFGNSIPV